MNGCAPFPEGPPDSRGAHARLTSGATPSAPSAPFPAPRFLDGTPSKSSGAVQIVRRAALRGRSRGMTLPEAILTIFLVGMVFGMAANLMSSGYSVLRFSALKENSVLTGQVALERMTSEAREATALAAPAVGGTSQELRLTKIDPTAPRFPGSTPWNPSASAMAVRYYTDGAGNLNRETSTGVETVVRGIYGLTCDRPADGTLRLKVAVFEARGVRSLTTAVYLP